MRVGDRIVLIGDYLNVSQLAQITFKPDPGDIGAIGSFDFNVMENRGGHASGSIPITVTQSNRPPVVAGERTLRVAVSQLGLEAPNDPDGDPLTMTVAALPATGKVRKGAQPLRMGEKLTAADFAALTYDPEQSAPGNAGSFAVLIDDGHGGKATASVKIEVAAPGSALSGPDLEDAMWQRVRTAGQPADFSAYLQLFPSGRNAPLARERLAAFGVAAQPGSEEAGAATDGNRQGGTASRNRPNRSRPSPSQKKPEPPKAEAAKPAPPAAIRRQSPRPIPRRRCRPRPATRGRPTASRIARNARSWSGCRQAPSPWACTRGDPSEQPGHKVTLAKTLRARHVRGDRCRMARLRSGRRLHRHAAHGPLHHGCDARP